MTKQILSRQLRKAERLLAAVLPLTHCRARYHEHKKTDFETRVHIRIAYFLGKKRVEEIYRRL